MRGERGGFNEDRWRRRFARAVRLPRDHADVARCAILMHSYVEGMTWMLDRSTVKAGNPKGYVPTPVPWTPGSSFSVTTYAPYKVLMNARLFLERARNGTMPSALPASTPFSDWVALGGVEETNHRLAFRNNVVRPEPGVSASYVGYLTLAPEYLAALSMAQFLKETGRAELASLYEWMLGEAGHLRRKAGLPDLAPLHSTPMGQSGQTSEVTR